MTDDERLDELLDLWQSAEESGRPLSATDLCADRPDLLAMLEGQIAVLRRFQDLVENDATGAFVGRSVNTAGNSQTADEYSGKLVGGYELREQIGHGGMGVVYKAFDPTLKRDVALKLMLPRTFVGGDHLSRFRFEAEAVASLQHPNIVNVFDYGEANGSPYLVMPLMRGSLSERPSEPPKKVAEWLRLIALGVHHAHQRGLLHRDLKPGNILFDENDQPHVADFGLAKRLDSSRSLSASGSIAGTAAYMAPEQARGDKGLTTAVDIHALGAILYELLTGAKPFGTGDLIPLIKRVSEDEATPARRLKPDLPADLEAICMKCLEKRPGDRYKSADELATDLDHFLRDEPVSARPPGLWDWLRQMLRTRPHPNYSWQVPLWLGSLWLVTNSAIYAMCEAEGTAGWVWLTNLGCATGMFVVFWWYMLRRFRDLPVTERQSLVIGVGHIMAHLALMAAFVPFSFTASARTCLVLYPSSMAITGLAVFTLGSTNWSRFFPMGILFFILAPVMAWWSDESPLIVGVTFTALLWYWTYAKRAYFAGRLNESP